MLGVVFALLLAASVWTAFTLGRVTADRRVSQNHHQMMMLVMELRQRDDTVPIMSSKQRMQLDRLLGDYARIDADDDSGSVTLAGVCTVVILVVAVIITVMVFARLVNPEPSLEQGRVEEKVYDDADEWYQPGQTIDGGQTCTGGYGNPPSPRVCTDNPDTHIPGMWHTEDERFLLKLRGPHPDEPDKMLNDTISVPESFYNKVRVGQWVDVDSLEIIPR